MAFDLHLKKRHSAMLAVLVMLALILFIYWPVQSYEFLNYDDQGYVTSNNLVQSGFSYNTISDAFSKIYLGNWHPLTMLSHILDWQLFGMRAGGHHWTSVIIHICNAVLLFLLFRAMTGAVWRSAFVAALFAVHPINVESVAWIAERKNVLSTFFWFLTMILYVWYAKSPNWKRYLLVFISFAWGLMSKPMLVTLPFALLLLDYWPLGRAKIKYQHADQAAKTIDVKKREEKILFLVLEKVPLFILSAISSYITIFAQKNAEAMVNLQSFPLFYRLGNAVISYGLYIKKMFWPFDLAVFYPLNYHMSLWHVILSVLLLIVITTFASVKFRRSPYLIVGWLWFLGTLVPVIGLVQVGDQAMADRYAYVAFIGLFIMLTWGASDILRKYLSSGIILAIALSVIISMTIVAHGQVKYWQDTFTLFSRALAVTKNNAVAHSNVAGELLVQNKVDEAMVHCEKALLLTPNDYNTLVRVARAYSVRSEQDKAVDALRRAIQVRPEYVRAYDDLYFLMMQTGKTKEALEVYRKAVETVKDNPDIYYHFGTALARQAHYDESIIQYKRALQLRPYDADVINNYGMVLMFSGKNDEAINLFKKTIKINPDHANAHYQLSIIMKQKGLMDEANYHYQEAVRVNPAYKK